MANLIERYDRFKPVQYCISGPQFRSRTIADLDLMIESLKRLNPKGKSLKGTREEYNTGVRYEIEFVTAKYDIEYIIDLLLDETPGICAHITLTFYRDRLELVIITDYSFQRVYQFKFFPED